MDLGNVHVILVEPIYPGNAGAVARSAYNYGIGKIKIIGDLDIGDEEAKKMSMYGYSLLTNAERFNSLETALADCTLVIGTVHQTRFNRSNPKPLWSIFDSIRHRLSSEIVGIVFGREDNGLTREEIDLCHYLAVIPTPGHLSFNIAHSATVFLYELYKQISEMEPAQSPARATCDDYESLFQILQKTLQIVGFFKGTQEPGVMTSIRDIVFRADFLKNDIPMMKAMLYKIYHSYLRLSRAHQR